MATNKSQATGKPGRGLHKKKTNKQDIKQNLYSQGKSADIICALIFGLYNVRHIFLPSTSNEHESFPSALVSLESSCCEFIIWSGGLQIQSLRAIWGIKDNFEAKTPSESMDNNITKTDYEGKKWKDKPIFHINYQINSIVAFVHKRVTILGGGTPLCNTKGMDFAPFLFENGYRICTFRSGIGYVLRGERRKWLNVLVVSFPNHKKRRNGS